jgi:hypothetical protein
VSEGTDETQEFRPPPSDSLTTPLPVTAPPRPGGASLGLIFLAVAAAAFLVGIAVASSMRTPQRGTVVASRSVGASGATVRFRGGELRIPRGALASREEITIRRAVFPNRVGIRLPNDSTAGVLDRGRLVAYSFEPGDLGFRKPVEIVFRLSGEEENGTIFVSQGARTTVLGGDVDADRGTVTLEVRTFRFAAS